MFMGSDPTRYVMKMFKHRCAVCKYRCEEPRIQWGEVRFDKDGNLRRCKQGFASTGEADELIHELMRMGVECTEPPSAH
jgi:hypothetical protein